MCLLSKALIDWEEIMKKYQNLLKICCLFLGLISLTGCFKRDDMEDISIVVSTYPIEYIVKSLFGS